MDVHSVYTQSGDQRRSAARKRINKRILILLGVLLCVVIAFCATWYLTADARLYAQGVAYLNEGEYALAIETFQQLSDYEDSPMQVKKCHYAWGNTAALEDRFDEARQHFLAAADYKDAYNKSQQMVYNLGHSAFLAGDYDEADGWFALLEDDITKYGDPHFRTLADAAPYLKEQQEKFANRVRFCVGEELTGDVYYLLVNLLIHQHSFPDYYRTTKAVVLDKIVYYPGDRIYHAWKNGDTSKLTKQEQQVLTLALSVVEEAKAQSETELELQIWLHDWLCRRVTYESPNMDINRMDYLQLTELSCIGAILEGKANCQGYTDAFCLLGRLAGFEVGKLFGDTGGGHTWNIILLDGLWYIVDVTFDDMNDEGYDGWNYTYFNTGWDQEVYSIYGGEQAIPELAETPHPTKNYFAHTQNSFTSIYDAAYDIVSQKLREGKAWTYVKIEDTVISPEQFNDTVYSIVQNRVYGYVSWACWAYDYDGDSYMIIRWH